MLDLGQQGFGGIGKEQVRLIKKENQQEKISAPAKPDGSLPQENKEDKKTVPAKSVQFVPLKPAKPAKKNVAHHLEIQCGPARIVVLEDSTLQLLKHNKIA